VLAQSGGWVDAQGAERGEGGAGGVVVEIGVGSARQFGQVGKRHPEVGAAVESGSGEALWRDADDGAGVALQTKLLSEDGAVAGKCFRPAGVGENDGVAVSWFESAAEQRSDAQIGEEVFGDGDHVGALLLAVLFQGARGVRLAVDGEEGG